MLKTRIITAAVIALVAFAVVFLIPFWGFALFMALLLLVGSWEYGRLAALGTIFRWLLLVLQATLFSLMAAYWSSLAEHAQAFLAAACLSWCVMFFRLVTFQPGAQPGINYRFISFFSALASVTFAGYALVWLRAQSSGEFLILLLLFIIWSADIGAYFSGRSLGRRKLAPKISPGKTWEGLAGGVVLALLVAYAVTAYGQRMPSMPVAFGFAVAVTVLASAAGDLFISIHKRTIQVKDSGRLFPGHGGVLDRFDSLLSGAPVFAMGTWLLVSQTS